MFGLKIFYRKGFLEFLVFGSQRGWKTISAGTCFQATGCKMTSTTIFLKLISDGFRTHEKGAGESCRCFLTSLSLNALSSVLRKTIKSRFHFQIRTLPQPSYLFYLNKSTYKIPLNNTAPVNFFHFLHDKQEGQP